MFVNAAQNIEVAEKLQKSLMKVLSEHSWSVIDVITI
jgi:hypothetical protein